MKKILSLFFLCLSLSATGNEIQSWSSPPETISTPGIDSSNPCVGMDSSGNSVAIWLEGSALVSKTKPVSSDWGTATTVAASNASQPQLVVDPAGNATAIWTQSGAIKTAYMPFGSSWGAATTLASSGSSNPQIAVDASGDVAAVWLASGLVQAKTRLFGGSWSLLASTLSGGSSAAPQVSIGDNGTVAVIWHTLNGVSSTYNVNVATATIGGLWSVGSLISNANQNSIYPQLDVDANGNILAVWFTYAHADGTYTSVMLQGAYMPSAGPWTSPANISNPGVRNPAELVATCKLSDNTTTGVAVWTNSYDNANLFLETATVSGNNVWSNPQQLLGDLYLYSADLAYNSNGDIFSSYMAHDPSNSNIAISVQESCLQGVLAGDWVTPVVISEGAGNGYPAIASVIVGSTNNYATAAWINYDGMNNVIQSSFGTGTAVTPPSGLAVVQSANNFGVFTEYYNVLTWDASPDMDITAYAIYRDGQFLNYFEGATLQFTDDNQPQSGAVVYGISAVSTSGSESSTVTVSFP